MTKLTIPLLNGEKHEAEATIVGDLAIHQDYKDPNLWSVTHVPTLMTFKKAVPKETLRSRTKLIKWCKAVQEIKELKKDWMAMRKFQAAEVLKNPEPTRGIRDRIRTTCLATKV